MVNKTLGSTSARLLTALAENNQPVFSIAEAQEILIKPVYVLFADNLLAIIQVLLVMVWPEQHIQIPDSIAVIVLVLLGLLPSLSLDKAANVGYFVNRFQQHFSVIR